MSMRYFEVIEPYYALLKAKNPENAKEIYTDVVEKVTPIVEQFEMKEVPVEYASIAYSRSLSQDGVSLESIVQSLISRTEMILTVDGCVA